MKFLVCIFALTISVTLVAYMPEFGLGGYGSSWGNGMIYSRRDVEAAEEGSKAFVPGTDTAEPGEKEEKDLYSQIDTMLAAAANGITIDEMGQLAAQIQKTAESAVDALGGEVDAAEVQTAIDKAASSLSGVVAVSALFDEPLVYEGYKMDAALCLLNSLSQRGRDQENTGKLSQATLAAISMTSQAIQDILTDTIGIVTLSAGFSDSKDVDKRWKFDGSVIRHPSGRVTAKARVQHTWNGRRKRREIQRSKRGFNWNGGLTHGGPFHSGSLWDGVVPL
ncbi:hypothetical protein PoB_000031100 [Plakobranchus ocellatus]|uniref:Uncharacterized protein n=1 Tax=Plakobranchus ocellatus TaxID=259542 RepID=A0AAV3WSR2_9GAST|nr:hypothetical protein PoB_000031100 [Plakobranchus ocellatus]